MDTANAARSTNYTMLSEQPLAAPLYVIACQIIVIARVVVNMAWVLFVVKFGNT